MNDVLLTVSGVIDPERCEQVRRGERPRADYLEMARAFGADLLEYAGARRLAGRSGRLLARLGGRNLLLAWACFLQRRRYSVIFTDGEQVGIPFAWLLKYLGGRQRPRHLMIAHVLSAGKKTIFFDAFRLQSHVDLFFVFSTWQATFIRERWKVPATRVAVTPFMVDTCFFAPDRLPAGSPGIQPMEGPTPPDPGGGQGISMRPARIDITQTEPLICAVGLEYRDYPTLLAAARDLPVRVVIAAASPWSKRPDTTAGQDLPANVVVRRFDQYELRRLYAESLFLVMPLFDATFQAGVTAILEAMAMGRAVICSRTRGQTDVVIEGETGIYVPPGDPGALRTAIERLLTDAKEAGRMGEAGRRLVEQTMSLDLYVERLAGYVRAAAESAADRVPEGKIK